MGNLKRKEKKLSLFKKIKYKILHLFRINHHPVVKVYDGYGDSEKIVLYGHVLKQSPMARKTYRKDWVVNTFSMLRLFMIKPFPCAKVSMEWQGVRHEAESQEDGLFKFEWVPEKQQSEGWHDVKVYLQEEKYKANNISGTAKIHVPYPRQFAFISDIDDTFLISHSSKLRKRLYVLFTKNARTRRPFEGVVRHYQLLSSIGEQENEANSFFYVSSSEWNLYDMITEFSRENHLPKGVYLLNQIKQLSEVLKTGQNKHSGKFTRIVRIIETYPQLQFILLGDDTQEDPNIYLSIAQHFPKNIFGVYIRKVNRHNFTEVEKIIEKIRTSGVHCCYFEKSSEAIEHSRSIGLVKAGTGA